MTNNSLQSYTILSYILFQRFWLLKKGLFNYANFKERSIR